MRMRPYNRQEIELIDRLISEGESIYGKSDCFGNEVQQYVQMQMLERGLRVKFDLKDEGDS